MNDLKTTLVLDEVQSYFNGKASLSKFTAKYTYKENFRNGVYGGQQTAFYAVETAKDNLVYIPVNFYSLDELELEAGKLIARSEGKDLQFVAYIGGWDTANNMAAVGLVAGNKQERYT